MSKRRDYFEDSVEIDPMVKPGSMEWLKSFADNALVKTAYYKEIRYKDGTMAKGNLYVDPHNTNQWIWETLDGVKTPVDEDTAQAIKNYSAPMDKAESLSAESIGSGGHSDAMKNYNSATPDGSDSLSPQMLAQLQNQSIQEIRSSGLDPNTQSILMDNVNKITTILKNRLMKSVSNEVNELNSKLSDSISDIFIKEAGPRDPESIAKPFSSLIQLINSLDQNDAEFAPFIENIKSILPNISSPTSSHSTEKNPALNVNPNVSTETISNTTVDSPVSSTTPSEADSNNVSEERNIGAIKPVIQALQNVIQTRMSYEYLNDYLYTANGTTQYAEIFKERMLQFDKLLKDLQKLETKMNSPKYRDASNDGMSKIGTIEEWNEVSAWNPFKKKKNTEIPSEFVNQKTIIEGRNAIVQSLQDLESKVLPMQQLLVQSVHDPNTSKKIMPLYTQMTQIANTILASCMMLIKGFGGTSSASSGTSTGASTPAPTAAPTSVPTSTPASSTPATSTTATPTSTGAPRPSGSAGSPASETTSGRPVPETPAEKQMQKYRINEIINALDNSFLRLKEKGTLSEEQYNVVLNPILEKLKAAIKTLNLGGKKARLEEESQIETKDVMTDKETQVSTPQFFSVANTEKMKKYQGRK